jgi:hypothetical protein
LFSQTPYTAYNDLDIKSFVLTTGNKCLLLTYDGSFIETDTSTGNVYWKSQISFQGPPINNARKIIKTADQNYVALISNLGVDNYFSAIKITGGGSLIWVKKYSFTSFNSIRDIIATPDSGFIMVGGGCNGTNIVFRCDVSGDIIWQKQYIDPMVPGGEGWYISNAGNDSYYIFGRSNSNNYVFKIDGAGNLVWYRKILLNGVEWNGGIVSAKDGGVTIAGHTNVLDSNIYNLYISHFDSSGNNLWLKVYTSPVANSPVNYQLIQMLDNSYILAGLIYYNDIRNNQNLIVKTDASGEVIWANTAGVYPDGLGTDGAYCIEKLSESRIMVGGFNFLSKLNVNGSGWCHDEKIALSSNTPSYSIQDVSPLVYDITFQSDTIAYTYLFYSPTEPSAICVNNTNAISEADSKNDAAVFPNPFSESLNFASGNDEPMMLILYDVTANKILEHPCKTATLLMTNQLENGIYMYELLNHNGVIKKGKLVKI